MKIEIFKDKASGWRWHIKSKNGRVIADSGEGYQLRAGAIKGLRALYSVLDAYNSELLERAIEESKP